MGGVCINLRPGRILDMEGGRYMVTCILALPLSARQEWSLLDSTNTGSEGSADQSFFKGMIASCLLTI